MKKTLIFGLTLVSAFAFTGCSTSNEEAIMDRLSHQLDRTTNAVNLVANDNANELTLEGVSKLFNDKATQTDLTTLSNAYQASAKSAASTSESSNKIHRKIKSIKKSLAGGIKLGNENASAINDLTTSMQKYTTSLNKTKSDYKNTAKNINKLNETNSSELEAKLTRLSCCVEARNCYMQNLLLTLENIENILKSIEDTDEENINIPSQNSDDINEQVQTTNENTSQNLNNQNIPNGYPANNNFLNNNAYNNGLNGYPNFAGTNGFGYGYNGNWRGGFNPDRNTDTYGPGITNIDTYKFYGNNRRFQGSNGITMIDDENLTQQNDTENENSAILEDESLSAEKSFVDSTILENEINTDIVNKSQIATKSSIIDNQTNSPKLRPNIKPRKNMDLQNAVNDSEPDFEVNPIDNKDDEKGELAKNTETNDLKIRSVSTDIEKSFGEDKPKGHTQTTSADINKKIEKLIK